MQIAETLITLPSYVIWFNTMFSQSVLQVPYANVPLNVTYKQRKIDVEAPICTF